MSWNILSSKEIFRNRWLWLTEDDVETDTGARATYAVVHKKPFALIIPWDGERFTLVRQYRYQVDFDSLEFPQGHYEHDSIEETAQRELKEETGLSSERIEQIGSFFAASGAMDQECMVFLATGLTEGERELEQSEEGLTACKMTHEEVTNAIKQGKIKDGPTIAALSLFSMSIKSIMRNSI